MTNRIIGSGLGRKAVTIRQLDDFMDWLVNQGEEGTDPQALYAHVAWTFWAANLRANAVIKAPYHIYTAESDEDIPENEIESFDIDLTDTLWRVQMWLQLVGAGYVHKNENIAGVQDLQVLNANTMSIVKESVTKEGPQEFRQKIGANEKIYRADQILYFQTFSPRIDWGPGVASGSVGQKSGELVAQSNAWAAKFFENGAIPAVFLTTDSPVPPSEQKEIESRWDRMLRGVKNAFKTKVLGRGLVPTVIGQPIKDLAMPDLARIEQQQILAAHGIPIGYAEAKTNRAERQALHFELWTDWVIPEIEHYLQPVIDEQLLVEFDARIGWDWSSVEAIQNAELEKAEGMSFVVGDVMLPAYDANVVSVDETRAVVDSLLGSLDLPRLDATFTPEERMPAIPFGGVGEQTTDSPESPQSEDEDKSVKKKLTPPQWGSHRVSLSS
jgi:hypothetical protein